MIPAGNSFVVTLPSVIPPPPTAGSTMPKAAGAGGTVAAESRTDYETAQQSRPLVSGRSPRIALTNLGDHRRYGQIDDGLGLASVGLESIATYLNLGAVDTILIDQAVHGLTDPELLYKLIKFSPEIVGLNPLINTRGRAGTLATRLKEFSPDVMIVIGGYDATFLSLTNPLYADVDVIVRGKGEMPMRELVRAVRGEVSLEGIRGISYRTENGVVENRDERAQELSPDELPIPERQDLTYLIARGEPVSIYASYGCNYRCGFCSTPRFYSSGRVERKLEDVLAEIDRLAGAGVKKFSFYDEDLFGTNLLSLQRADRIIRRVGERGGEVTFAFITARGVEHAERLGLLAQWKGVLNRLYLGVEGGTDSALKALGNASCRESRRNAEAIRTVRGHNIGLQIGFMMFHPYSTFEELESSAKFLRENDEAANAISFFHHLRPYGGTEMYERLAREGLLIEGEALSEMDLHSGIPYRFAADLHEGNDSIASFARAICPTSGEDVVCESDKLVNEVYLRLVRTGYGGRIFDAVPAPGAVRSYRMLRRHISNLNYYFFTESLRIFRDRNGEGFDTWKATYLERLGHHAARLARIKAALDSKRPA